MRWDELIPEEQWDEENRSDVEFEKKRDRVSKDARNQRNEDPDKEPCTMPFQVLVCQSQEQKHF